MRLVGSKLETAPADGSQNLMFLTVTPVNIGDLMAKFSGNRWVATFLRVRFSKKLGAAPKGGYLVLFFFEPGLNCVVKSLDGGKVVYGEHVLKKMKGWVEFRDVVDEIPGMMNAKRMEVEVY
jgi:isopenicillin N synthase-like dioxygenase